MRLPPGTYVFAFRLRCSDNTVPKKVATLEVRAARDGQDVLLASRAILATDFRIAGGWQVFSLTAEVQEGDDICLRVVFHPGTADLWCDWVRVQPAEPRGHELLELPPELWLDELLTPIRARRGLEVGSTRLRGPGTPRRPLRLEGRRSAVLEVAGRRRLVLGPSYARFERYDEQAGAWVEQASAELLESWRDPEEPGKIRLPALKRYPFGPEDLSVPGLDGQGRLRLTEIGEKAASLDTLASARSWGSDELLLSSEVFEDKSSWRLRAELTDHAGRPLVELVRSSPEIGPDGVIQPGAITVEKVAADLGVEVELRRDLDEAIYSTGSDAFILVKTCRYETTPDIKLELLAVEAELRSSSEEASAYLRVTWQAGDGPEQLYLEAQGQGTMWTQVGREEAVLLGYGQELVVRFYLRADTAPPGETYVAYMRNALVRVKAYGRRITIPG